MRLFIALELPPEAKAAAAETARELKRTGADVKWVKPEAMHLTLKFLGEVGEDRLEEIKAGLDRAAGGRPALSLELAGCGAFPRPQAPRVVWLGLAGDLEPLAELARAVEAEMAGLGFPPEDRPFKPHLTLGRLRQGRRRGGPKPPPSAPLTRELVARAAWQGPAFTGREVTIFQSTLSPAGATYTVLSKVTLT